MSEAHYIPAEERLNIITHAFGAILSIIGMGTLMNESDNWTQLISSITFGMSLIILYTASTLYHAAKDSKRRAKLRVFDHASIYVLIAGTYTPICLITLSESIGIILLGVIWGVAICGVVLKLFFTGQYDRLSTIMYVAMGWIAIFAIKPLLATMDFSGLLWLLIGGIFYTLGAILYSIRSLPFNHAIFHFFVLGGSVSHFIMIYSYVL